MDADRSVAQPAKASPHGQSTASAPSRPIASITPRMISGSDTSIAAVTTAHRAKAMKLPR